jgi:regulator of RNase E activity RraA
MDYAAYLQLATTTLADVLKRDRIMGIGIRPLWPQMPRIAGPAYTVSCPPGDNLTLHAAIYRAAPGSIIVVQAGDLDYALAGGNVCAIAKKRGVVGFVLDGVIRDIAEAREMEFPVYARGVIPIAGGKRRLGSLREPVQCGGILVSQGDVVVADEDGIVVVRNAEARSVLAAAQARVAKAALQSMEMWEADHRRRVEELLVQNGFRD